MIADGRLQVVRLGRDESGTYVLCGYFDQDNTLRIQADERVTGQPDLTNTDIGLDDTQQTNFNVDRIEEVSVPGPVDPTAAVGIVNAPADAAPQTVPAPPE